ncbi:hypothetical protein ACSZNS_20420, partial [Aeromonas caviae]
MSDEPSCSNDLDPQLPRCAWLLACSVSRKDASPQSSASARRIPGRILSGNGVHRFRNHCSNSPEYALSSSELNRIGKFTGFCQRLRDIQPARLLPALLSGLGCDKVDGIAGLHRHFNALQLHDTDQIAYKPFHNQLRKQGFPLFMRALVERAIAL